VRYVSKRENAANVALGGAIAVGSLLIVSVGGLCTLLNTVASTLDPLK
jgi:hypothetical protein